MSSSGQAGSWESWDIPVVPNCDDLVNTFFVEYVDDVLRESASNVELRISRFVRSAIGKQIGNDETISHRLKKGDLFAPEVGCGGEAVREEENRLALSRWREVIRVGEPSLGLNLFVIGLIHCCVGRLGVLIALYVILESAASKDITGNIRRYLAKLQISTWFWGP